MTPGYYYNTAAQLKGNRTEVLEITCTCPSYTVEAGTHGSQRSSSLLEEIIRPRLLSKIVVVRERGFC